MVPAPRARRQGSRQALDGEARIVRRSLAPVLSHQCSDAGDGVQEPHQFHTQGRHFGMGHEGVSVVGPREKFLEATVLGELAKHAETDVVAFAPGVFTLQHPVGDLLADDVVLVPEEVNLAGLHGPL